MARILTMADLEAFYGGRVKGLYGSHELMKTDAPILTSTSNYLNQIYGAKAWAQINGEANVFGIIPKTLWSRSGIRLITGLESTYTDLGIAEAATLPDTIKPTIAKYALTPKTQCKTFEISDVMQSLADAGSDDLIGTHEQLRHFRSVDFARGINQQLLHDVEAEAAAAVGNYSEGYCTQTLDRLISNDTEEDNYGGTYTGYYDYYTLDRDTSTTYADAYVSQDADADQELDDELLRKTIAAAKNLGGQTSVMVTGHDTYAQIQGIYQTFMRYDQLPETQVEFGLQGIKTAKGIDAGTKIAAVLGIPTLVSQDVTVDGTSRIYGLDIGDPEGLGEPRLGLNTLRPVEYFEGNDPLYLDKFVHKGAYRMISELAGRFFPGQWKIRDLSA